MTTCRIEKHLTAENGFKPTTLTRPLATLSRSRERGDFSDADSQGGVRDAALPWAELFLPRWGGSESRLTSAE